MSGFLKNGTDLDNIFEPRGTSTARAGTTGFQINGGDIMSRYYNLALGGSKAADVGFKTNGTDISNYFAAKGTVSYGWASQLGPGWANYQSTHTDSSGNIFAVGIEEYSDYDPNILLVKYNSTGAVVWQKSYRSAYGDTDYGNCVTTDSSGNIYLGGSTNTNKAFLFKLDSSGNIIWYNYYFSITGYFSHLALDTSGNIHVCGRASSSVQGTTGYGISVMKFNPSGTLLWQRVIDSSLQDLSGGIKVNSSGDVYVAGATVYSGSYLSMYLAKFNASGTLQWHRALHGASSSYARGLDLDSSGNVYISGEHNFTPVLAKYNSSGTLLSKVQLVGATSSSSFMGIDSSNTVYLGSALSSGSISIVALNSANTILWQRAIGNFSGQLHCLDAEASGNVLISGQIASSNLNAPFIAKISGPSTTFNSLTFTPTTYSISDAACTSYASSAAVLTTTFTPIANSFSVSNTSEVSVAL